MTDARKSNSDRSVSIVGNFGGSVIQTGDRNIVSVQHRHAPLPPPERVDIRAELMALRAILAHLDSPDHGKITQAFDNAEGELAKAHPAKDEVGKALDRALDYAKKAEGFAKSVETLTPHVTNAAAWLGNHWHKLLPLVGPVV